MSAHRVYVLHTHDGRFEQKSAFSETINFALHLLIDCLQPLPADLSAVTVEVIHADLEGVTDGLVENR